MGRRKKKKELNDDNLKSLIDLDDLMNCMKDMEAGERAKTYLKLMEFVVPKKQSVQQDINTNVKDEAQKLVEKLAGTYVN